MKCDAGLVSVVLCQISAISSCLLDMSFTSAGSEEYGLVKHDRSG